MTIPTHSPHRHHRTGVIARAELAVSRQGLQVVATDIAPMPEAALRKFVETACPRSSDWASRPERRQSNLTFTADSRSACCVDLVRRTGRADRFQAEALWAAGRAAAARRDHRVELVGLT